MLVRQTLIERNDRLQAYTHTQCQAQAGVADGQGRRTVHRVRGLAGGVHAQERDDAVCGNTLV